MGLGTKHQNDAEILKEEDDDEDEESEEKEEEEEKKEKGIMIMKPKLLMRY